jgi:hypothetical protein
MMKGRRKKAFFAITMAVVVLLLAGVGIAYATIPDSNGVIHACYQTLKGSLRVVDSTESCSNGEAPLSWNQTGPPGPPGVQGPPGPSGSSHAYTDSNEQWQAGLSPNATTITQLTLPAGNYVVLATGSVVKNGIFNTTGSDNDVKCFLNDPNDNTLAASEATASGDYTAAVPYMLVGTVSLPTGGTITVDCATLTGSVASEVDFNSLVATKVDAVN